MTAVAEDPQVKNIDASTLDGKVLCGYQGWFRCPDDGTNDGWLHWSRDSKRLTPSSTTFEMWPDLSDYSPQEKFPAPEIPAESGEPSMLFSSAHPRTIERHFEWMRDYGIDGVFLQRFLVNLNRPSFEVVLEHARQFAKRTGRVYAMCYDLSGTRTERLYEQLTADWRKLVDEKKLTHDDRYLHHQGKPVVFVWGFFSDRFDGKLANRIIDFFQAEGRYQAHLIGGCQWYWQRETDPEWAKAFRRLDTISPWNVGNYTLKSGEKWAATDYWFANKQEAEKHGAGFLPVVYPGFSWVNLKGPSAKKDTIPRLGGRFYWRQFEAAARLNVKTVYVAMFDEVDEATAIFKVSNAPPKSPGFVTYEGLPTDWYLRLTGEGRKLIRGDRPLSVGMPNPAR